MSLWNIPVYEGIPILVTYDAGSDNDSCPDSGSARLTYYGFAFGSINQCVAASANVSYHFGYRFKQASAAADDAGLCMVTSHAGDSCSGDALDSGGMMYYSGPASTTWASPSLSTFYTTPAGTGSVKVSCQANNLFDVWYDQIYLNASAYY